MVAVAAAAAVLLAGGGAFWAAAGGDQGEAGPAAARSDDPAPLALDGYGGDGGTAEGSRAEYRAEGELPQGPGEASVHRPAGQVDAEAVTALARALGIAAGPEKTGEGWRAADGADGAGPALVVNGTDGGTWTFTRYVRPDDGKGTGTGPAQPIAPPVSPQEAREIAAPVLAAAGLAGADVDAERTAGALRTVVAAPEAGELPTRGWQTTVTVGADGVVVQADGHLGRLERGAVYPVLSARETLRELNESGAGAAIRCVQAPCEVPAGAREGSRTVTGAEFALTALTSDGQPLLVPSWLFRTEGAGGAEDGATVSFPAVAPRFLTPGPGADSGAGQDTLPAPPAPVHPAPDQPGPGQPPGQPEPGHPVPDRPVPAEPTAKPPQGNGSGPGAVPPADPDDPVGPPHAGMPVASYGVAGRELVLRFTGGVCGDYRATAEAAGDQVRVTVTEHTREPGQVCVLMAKEHTLRVSLDRPLGDRVVVDAAGEPIPER